MDENSVLEFDKFIQKLQSSKRFEFRKISEYPKIDEILNRLNNVEGNILRAKGIISTESEKWIQFDYVPGEVIIRDTTPDCIGRICVIGEHINEDVLSLLFEL